MLTYWEFEPDDNQLNHIGHRRPAPNVLWKRRGYDDYKPPAQNFEFVISIISHSNLSCLPGSFSNWTHYAQRPACRS